MKFKAVLTALFAMMAMFFTAPFAHADESITLGRTIVFEENNYGADIPLVVCRRADAIRVKADRDMYLREVVLTFKNGDTKTVHFYRNVKKDKKTGWRSLGYGYKRCVKRLEVFATSKHSSAGIRIYGRQ